MAIPEVKVNIHKKTMSERSFLKLMKSKFNDAKRKLDPTFNKRRNKWVRTTQLTDLAELLKMATAIDISIAR